MAKRPTITTVSSGYLSQETINENFEIIRDHFDTLLSLNGDTPNQLTADVDLNDNNILNAGAVNAGTLRLNGTLVVPTELSETGAVEAPLTLSDNSTHGIDITGNYSVGALLVRPDQKIGFDATATNYIHWNSTTNSIEFVVGGDVGFAVDANGSVGSLAVSVDNEGAVGDGSTDDTSAFQAAIDELPASGGVISLTPNKNYAVTIGSLTTGGKKILWTGGGRVNDSAVWTLPGIQESWDTTTGRMFYNKEDSGVLDGSYKDNRRNADYSGGATGELDYLERWETTIASTVGSSGNRKGEKTGLFRVNNQSNYANGVALFCSAFAEADGAVWSHECSTHSEVTPTTYAHRSAEWNVHGYGADPNQLRWVGNFVAHNETQVYSGTPGTDEVAIGVEIYPDTADMDYGLRIRTLGGSGTTKGTIQESALRIDSNTNDLIQAVSGSESGVFKFGSKNDSGIVGQFLGVGNDSAASSVNYTEVRSQVSTNTSGSHDGILKLMVADGGTMTEYFRINAGAANPIQIAVGGTLKDVTEGATDSGGTGFKALVVPN